MCCRTPLQAANASGAAAAENVARGVARVLVRRLQLGREEEKRLPCKVRKIGTFEASRRTHSPVGARGTQQATEDRLMRHRSPHDAWRWPGTEWAVAAGRKDEIAAVARRNRQPPRSVPTQRRRTARRRGGRLRMTQVAALQRWLTRKAAEAGGRRGKEDAWLPFDVPRCVLRDGGTRGPRASAPRDTEKNNNGKQTFES